MTMSASNAAWRGEDGWAGDEQYQLRRLRATILLRALADAVGSVGSGDRAMRREDVVSSARRWIAIDDDEDDASFAVICDELGVCRSVIRRALGIGSSSCDTTIVAMLRHGERAAAKRGKNG